MEINSKTTMLLCILSLVIGAVGGYKSAVPIIKTITVSKDKIVTVTKIVHDKNGNTTEESTRTEDKKSADIASKPETKLSPQWLVSVGSTNSHDIIIGVNRRILGPVFVGVTGATNGSLSLNVGWEF
jgi:hypothetical protein